MWRYLSVKEPPNHQITGYSELKGTHEDHSVQILALHRHPNKLMWCGGWLLSKILHPVKKVFSQCDSSHGAWPRPEGFRVN